MAMLSLTGIDDLLGSVTAEIDAFEQQCIEETKGAARLLTQEMMARTPVWSGKTVRNFAWGVNSAPAGGQQEPIGGLGYQPGGGWSTQRKGDPGATGLMGLGEEPRRAANESAALEEMEGVLSSITQLGTLAVTNFSDIWDLVDNGSAPTAERARNPGGVSILAEQTVKAMLGDTFK